MPLEGPVTYISDLNASNPAGTDQKAQGDDHVRNTKTALKNSFPNVNGAVNFTPAQANLLASIAALTVLANGTNAAAAPTAIAAATDGQVFRRAGTALAFGAVDLASAAAVSKTIQMCGKVVNTSRASTTTQTDDPELNNFIIEANKLYRVEALIYASCAATPASLKSHFEFSQTPQQATQVTNGFDADGSNTVWNLKSMLVDNTTALQAGVAQMTRYQGFILGHATNQGIMTWRWAQFTSNVTPTIVSAGSHIVLTRLN